jgi:hypothetical protein
VDLSVILKCAVAFEGKQRLHMRGKAKMPGLSAGYVDMLIVRKDDKRLYQVVVMDGIPQAFYYDMKAVRERYPKAEFGRNLDPRRYAEILAASKPDGPPYPYRDDGKPRLMYTVTYREGFAFAPVPGCPIGLPKPRKIKFSVHPDDKLPRKVEALDEEDRCFLTVTFDNVKLLDKMPEYRPPGKLSREETDEALREAVDWTDTLPAMLEG